MITIKNIYLDKPISLLEKTDISIYDGQITGIIGNSGCGKTTLLLEMALMGKHQFEYYRFNNYSIEQMNHNEKNEFLRQNICYVMQDIYQFDNFTINETLNLYGKLNNKELTHEEKYAYMNYVNLSLDLNTPVSYLSGGEKQRLCIVCGLLKKAELYIFDEPFAYLDKSNVMSIFDIIKKIVYEKQKMVIISTHDVSLHSEFDRVYKMENRQLCAIKESHQVNYCSTLKMKPFCFDVLKYYLSLYKRNHKIKLISVSFVLSLILSMLITMSNYNDNFQQVHGASLLELMDNQVILLRKDGNHLSAHQQSVIKNTFSDYQMLAHHSFTDNHEVVIVPYHKKVAGNFDIYKKINEKSFINNQEVDDIYMSYSLYRMIKDESYYFSNFELNIQASIVLSPLEEDGHKIYISYDAFEKIALDNQIELSLMEVPAVSIVINEIEDINNIKYKLINDVVMMENEVLGKSVDFAHIFEKESIMFFMDGILLIVMIYQIYDIIKVKNDIILFKMNGISQFNLMKMMLYQQISVSAINVILTSMFVCIAFIFLEIFKINVFAKMVMLTFLYNVGMSLILLIVYGCVIRFLNVSHLLRKAR